MTASELEQDLGRIKAIIAEKNQRYQTRGGSVRFAGVEGAILKIAPDGFCWR